MNYFKYSIKKLCHYHALNLKKGKPDNNCLPFRVNKTDLVLLWLYSEDNLWTTLKLGINKMVTYFPGPATAIDYPFCEKQKD